ncbi:MAG: mechanosensitive ion channel family protein [Okeania sp. SIO2G4]|uniref:mechanosensitive ion channel family protein n=1 Tax=unclassified Okeania TaxID=2634635 RepID=UPI0013B83F6D|nr:MULTISPECIES: mechanosensitive ion channel family protein [unclassified Okeania]NEP72288.1 mechanosensitive ion channel family protein [Okeania sp. SIO2G5]NEP93193.1 mechanosensitive ion channel family protein [Okeania sp. SIO2F5]NEQ90567.1 mechanosensitive ion channel family protein [Okeania sp. SIO2G4]
MLTLLQTSNSSAIYSLPWLEQGGILGIAIVLGFFLYLLVFSVLKSFFRRSSNEIGILTINILQTPLLILFVLIVFKVLTYSLNLLENLPFIHRLLTAGIVVVTTYLINQLFTQVIAYSLSKYAEKTEADWDDVLIPLIKNTLPILVYLIGGFLFLQTLGIDLSGLWVAFGGITFVLGFALKDILSNFFSGLVLLVDTPFKFGDVVALEDGSVAVIKSIGIRLTTLYLIESHCDLLVPNAALQSQKLINFSRPNSSYYYTIIVPIRADSDPNQAIKIIEEVILSHPDTLGDIKKKLVAIENFYRVTDQLLEDEDNLLSKKEAGRQRLIAEEKVKVKLEEIKQAITELVSKIKFMEIQGLDSGEVREIQGYYLDIVRMVGLETVSEKQKGQKSLYLQASQNMDEDTLINLLRSWYRNWQDDPDLIDIDNEVLENEWERKIDFLTKKMNKLLQQIVNANRSLSETKLDDYTEELWKWIEERFQTYASWQSPRIWMQDMSGVDVGLTNTNMAVKFFVDNVKLEQCQRGNRIRSEVHGEIVRRLRQAYFYR